jgi:quercetin dioxygenase-like cupin family protein
LVFITVLGFACQKQPATDTVSEKSVAVFPKGNPAGNKIFTNKVWVEMLETDKDKNYDTQVYNVTFGPGGRTHWHSHPGGQILLVTSGKGYYQEKGKPAQQLNPGDVVSIPPNVVHWHGAAPESEFVHLGMSTQVHLGPAEWFGPVTDEEYSNL